jgi:hypothetical protein
MKCIIISFHSCFFLDFICSPGSAAALRTGAIPLVGFVIGEKLGYEHAKSKRATIFALDSSKADQLLAYRLIAPPITNVRKSDRLRYAYALSATRSSKPKPTVIPAPPGA